MKTQSSTQCGAQVLMGHPFCAACGSQQASVVVLRRNEHKQEEE